MKPKILTVVAAFSAWAISSTASAQLIPPPGPSVVIDFEGFTPGVQSNLIAEDGYQITGQAFFGPANLFIANNTGSKGLNVPGIGAPMEGGTISRVGGGTFDIYEMDIFKEFTGLGFAGSIFFQSTDSLGNIHAFTAFYPGHTPGIPVAETLFHVDLSGYDPVLVRNVSSFTLINGADPWQFDNIVVSAVQSGVPEPATWAMMIAGFGFVGGAMRRRVRMALHTA